MAGAPGYDGWMRETIEVNFGRPMAVFPLPGCVLLPHACLDLHIFEPRYRQMVRDALDSHGLIAMGLFQGHVSQEDYEHGRPRIRPHVCVGYVEWYRPLEEGRYLLRLRGLCRAKALREEPHEPYRMFYLQPTDLSQEEDPELTGHRQRLEELLNDPVMRKVQGVEELGALLDQPIPTTALIDIVAMQVCDDPEQRYPMLAETRAPRRGEALTAHLEGLRRRLAVVDP
jgi:uncharacterized protein